MKKELKETIVELNKLIQENYDCIADNSIGGYESKAITVCEKSIKALKIAIKFIKTNTNG